MFLINYEILFWIKIFVFFKKINSNETEYNDLLEPTDFPKESLVINFFAFNTVYLILNKKIILFFKSNSNEIEYINLLEQEIISQYSQVITFKINIIYQRLSKY